MRILTKNQSVDLDKNTIEKYNITQDELMMSAANSIVATVENYSSSILELPRILILCGKGTNGGDAICAAGVLHKKNYGVHVHFLIEKNEINGLASRYHEEFVNSSGSISYGIELIKYEGFDIIIDGIIGIGFRDGLSEKIVSWVRWINQSDLYVIAIDISSGLNSDNGLASPVAIKANKTVTFGFGKVGLYLADGKDHSGDIEVADIGVSYQAIENIDKVNYKLFDSKKAEKMLVSIPSNTYKQDRGKVLIIAGSTGMTGAAVLSTFGALRTGAGVTITVCPSSLNDIYEKYILEGMTLSCEDNGRGYLSIHNYDEIIKKIGWADSIVIGPGLGLNNETMELVIKLIQTVNKPIVLDADGLSCFNDLRGPLEHLIITPHLGEFSKILNIKRHKIVNDFINIVAGFMKNYKGTARIKHVPACIVYDNQLSLNSTGNSGLATAGSGDVLSGMIASFIAQEFNKYDACRLSSYLHGKAADNIVKKRGKRGLIASDLPLEMAKIIGEYENI